MLLRKVSSEDEGGASGLLEVQARTDDMRVLSSVIVIGLACRENKEEAPAA